MTTWAQWAPTIVVVITAIFMIGRTDQRIKGHDKALANHDDELEAHRDRLNAHDIAIATTEGWRAGYDAGKGKQ